MNVAGKLGGGPAELGDTSEPAQGHAPASSHQSGHSLPPVRPQPGLRHAHAEGGRS